MINALLAHIANDPLIGIVIIVGFVAFFGFVFSAWRQPVQDRVGDRLKSLHTTTYGDMSAVEATLVVDRADDEDIPATASARIVAGLADIIAPLPLVGAKEQTKIVRNLTRAGFRSPLGVPLFMLVKLGFIAAGAIGAVIFLLAKPDLEIPILIKAVIVVAAAMVGGLLPENLLKRRGAARSKRVAFALPDAMDLMVICAEAGLSLEVALDRVAREMAMAAPDLSDEFSLTVAELQLLSDRRQALVNLADRTDLEVVRGVVTTLIQAQKYGTPLSQSLRVLGNEMRSARMLMVEEKAARMPALISMPLIGLVLPALFLIIGGPAIIEVSRLFGGS